MWNYDSPQPLGVSLGSEVAYLLKVLILVSDYGSSIEFSWLNSGLWFASFDVVIHNVCWLTLVRLFLYLPVAVTFACMLYVCLRFIYVYLLL